MTESYEIVIAGGGPAGLMTAQKAAANGAEVLLLELQAQIGQTQTSAWIPPKTLEKDLKKATKSNIEKIKLHSTHQELEINGDFGKIIDRGTFDRLLASKAIKTGADIWIGSPVTDLIKEKNEIRGVKSEIGEWSEEIKSEIIIDATGTKTKWSSLFLRNILNLDWDKEKINQTNEYLMANTLEKKQIDIYFNSFLAPRGHAWIYPLDQDFATAGIRGIRIHPDSALDEFIGKEEPERLRGSIPIGETRGQLPIQGPLEKTTNKNILAVGSSAGQIYPLSGHGIKYALEAGKIAGRIISEAIQEENSRKEKLSDYEQIWRNKFEKEIQIGMIIRNSLEKSPERKINTLLKTLKENPDIQNDFINIFLGEKLDKSLKNFFKNKKSRQIFGEKTVEKVFSLYP